MLIGQTMPFSSWQRSTTAAIVRPMPIPYEPITSGTALPSSSSTVAPSVSL